jgi:hypothetical protein
MGVNIYGDYYTTGLTKGGALSICGRILLSYTDSKHDIDQKFSLNGDVSKLVKGNVSNEIAFKRTQLS